MNSIYQSTIHTIRRFNRFYTNVLGLLDQHMLDSDYSLSEARILYEIGHSEGCTAKKLIEVLRIDPGYLSRIIKGFEKQGLTYRVRSTEDGRLYLLYLTDKGRQTLLNLNELSDQQIHQMLNQLSDVDQKRLVKGMEMVEETLSGKPDSTKISIRSTLKPGDVGQLIYLHGWIYAQECGYNHGFEGYVCKTFYDFFQSPRPDLDRFWLAEVKDEIVGAIAILGHSPEVAQLRWFILHPRYRGIGLGKTLLEKAVEYCYEKKFKRVFLETTEDQETAISMYTRAGFRKVSEHESSGWEKTLVEQTFELIPDHNEN